MTPQEAATAFDEMARKIRANEGNGFGGAAVIVHPDGNPVELLLVGGKDAAPEFLSMLLTRINVLMAEAGQSKQQGFGAIRR